MTLGHHNSTMEQPEYLEVLTRAILYVTGKLDGNGNPKKGYASVKRENYITEKSAKGTAVKLKKKQIRFNSQKVVTYEL